MDKNFMLINLLPKKEKKKFTEVLLNSISEQLKPTTKFGKIVNFDLPTFDKKEVVYTNDFLDIGLLESDYSKIYSRVWGYNNIYLQRPKYGGIKTVSWYHTGVFLTYEQWAEISFEKGSDEIIERLNLKRKR